MSDLENESGDQCKRDLDFGRLIENFIDSIESLYVTLPIFMEIIQHSHKKYMSDLDKLIDKFALKKEDKGNKWFIALDTSHQNFNQISNKLNKITNALKKLSKAMDLIPKNNIVSLVSQYDAFIGELMAAIYLKKPEILNNSDKNIGVKDILMFSNIDEAKEFIIEKEIEVLLRKSHIEQYSTLENIFGIPLRKELPVWPKFVELTQRRNLFVHCDGIISSQYINNCVANGVNLKDKCKVGTKLEASPEYLESAFHCLYEIGIKLAQVLWRKIFPNEIELADNNLNGQIIYNLLDKEMYDLAINLSDFACDVLKKYSSDVMRRMFIVNRAIAYKFSGKGSIANDILKNEDWSASDIVFKLSVAVLEDRFDYAVELMNNIGTTNDWVNRKAYSEWPLFKEFRKNGLFLKAYKDIFGSDYEQTELLLKYDGRISEENDKIKN